MPLNLPVDGMEISNAAPVISVNAPVVVPVGKLRIGVEAVDDRQVKSLSVWWRGEKIAYQTGDGPTLRVDLDLPVAVGSQRLSIVARDDEGNRVRRIRYIRGNTTEGVQGPVVEE